MPSPLFNDLTPALVAALRGGQNPIPLAGLEGSARAWVLSRLIHERGTGEAPLVCVAADEEAAESLAHDLAFFLPNEAERVRLSDEDPLPYDAIAPERASTFERLAALYRIRKNRPRLLITTARALARRYLPPERFDDFTETLAVDAEFDRDRLAARLVTLGYENTPVVEDVGSFALRGGILDLYSPLSERPVRIEFFGDQIESLRPFDLETQRTLGRIESLELCPAREILFDERSRASVLKATQELAERSNRPSSQNRELLDHLEERRLSYGIETLLPGFFERQLASLFDYLPQETLFFLDDPPAIGKVLTELDAELTREYGTALERDELAFEPAAYYLPAAELQAALKARRVLLNQTVALGGLTAAYGTTRDLRKAIADHHGEQGALTPLLTRLSHWRDAGVYAAIACGSSAQADRLRRLLADRKVVAKLHPEPLPENPASSFDPGIAAHLFTGAVSSGFIDPIGKLAVLSEEEIFGQRTRRAPKRARIEQPFVAAFRELKEGDLVVHADYGIGRYAGLIPMQIRGIASDVLVIEYAGKDKVYLPVTRLRLLQKFSGADAAQVSLDRLGSNSWEKRRKAVKEQLLRIAAELLRIEAARRAHPGHAFSPPDDYYRQFEADFPFEETADQAKAIEEVLADMQRKEPMDRLVCGDVGYGKTEVALRAAFKAVLDKKQVAVLVPTTVLAAQHLRTFRERFKDYAVTVELVSRLHSAAQNRETLQRLAQGQIDLVVGTHRLLNADVSFKDLGLLVIDEEQRFGVTHKERLKRYRTQVDVLTLTATPIPRTLHLSMSGIREMSIIATPPTDRKAIRTFVMKYDEPQIAEAIRRELLRGGQVYFVHNRVETIEQTHERLSRLVPEARFGVAHGQMAEGALEKVMAAFVERAYDVLICTSIIESGLDIPSANTMIVDHADKFGLAQLYQIRGRVGRSHDRAYAYLLVPPHKPLTRDAEKRLEVLQSFSELGAGFSIASHDLEIRGAGNLLGPDQSGQIAEVGFDLYAQLLEEAVHELKGEPAPVFIEPDINLPLPTYIPDDYVPDIQLRLLFYKRFSQVATDGELMALKEELIDRFGDLPDEVENFAELMAIKADLRQLQIRKLDGAPGKLVLSLGQDALLEPTEVMALVQRSKGTYRLTPELKFIATFDPNQKSPREWFAACNAVLSDLYRCERRIDSAHLP